MTGYFSTTSLKLPDNILHPVIIFIDMNTVVPVCPDQHFIDFYRRHPFHFSEKSRSSTQQYQHSHDQHGLMAVIKHKVIDNRIVLIQMLKTDPFDKITDFPVFMCSFKEKIKNDRDNRQRNDQRDKKPDAYSYRLVIEQSPGNSSQKYQRHKYRTSRQHRRQQGTENLGRTVRTSHKQRISPFPSLVDIIDDDNRIIDHHPHPHNQTGERNGIDRQTDQLEKQYTDDHRNRYTDPDNHR